MSFTSTCHILFEVWLSLTKIKQPTGISYLVLVVVDVLLKFCCVAFKFAFVLDLAFTSADSLSQKFVWADAFADEFVLLSSFCFEFVKLDVEVVVVVSNSFSSP